MKTPLLVVFLTLGLSQLQGAFAGASPTSSVGADTPPKGIVVRLRAEHVLWQASETPVLKLEVINQGQREYTIVRSQDTGRLQVDDVWYCWTGDVDLKSSPFPPGREFRDIRVSLGTNWVAMREETETKQAPQIPQRPLKLAPGKHRICFAPAIRDAAAAQNLSVSYPVSNAVEIDTSLSR